MTIDNDHPTDLLAAYALHAIGGEEECTQLERHLGECPRCRSEVDSLRAVASALGNVGAPPPDQVWTKISTQLSRHRPAACRPLESVTASPRRHDRPARHRRPRALQVMGAVCGVAAVTIALMVASLVRSDDRVAQLQRVLLDPGTAAVTAALASPGHRLVELSGPTGTREAEIVLLRSGEGYLVDSVLSAAPAGRSYELWAVVAGRTLPVALMGRAPAEAAFTVASTPQLSALAITVEPAAGSLRPTSTPVAQGSV